MKPLARSFAALLALAFASTGTAMRAVAESPLTSEGLKPPQILAKYYAALAKLKTPKAISFDYTVEQLGLHDMEQTHHVYRSALDERDETDVVDGYTLKAPEVRIIADRGYPYDIHAVAPTAATYDFAYSGVTLEGDDVTYVFRTTAKTATGFGVSEMEIDGSTFLPKVLRFKVATAGASGSGQLSYVRAESYWVIAAAQVSAHLPNGSLAHENIKWSNYQFPASLPPSTFEAPRPAIAPVEPDVLATATPAVPIEPGAP